MAQEEKNSKVTRPGWNFFQNPLSYSIKKYFFEMLKDRYADNEPIIEWIASHTLTEREYEEVGKLMASIYEVGYLKAVDDHREKLENMGVRAYIRPENNAPTNPIFPQEKSG